MKRAISVSLLIAVVALSVGTIGCASKPKKGVTYLPPASSAPPTAVAPKPNPVIVPPDQGTSPQQAQQPVTQPPVTQQQPVKPVTPVQPPVTPGQPLTKDTGPQANTLKDLPVDQPIDETKFKDGIEAAPRDLFEGMQQDPDKFKSETVYFDFDRSTVKSGEASKVETVAKYLKEVPDDAILVDGHCDERGTEEYNRALGERRALAVREYLVRLGIGAERIRTRSWGEDKPAVMGQDEAAFSKNRRGEFILLLPQK
jgi:peptidoglycan-associated lipoprotein